MALSDAYLPLFILFMIAMMRHQSRFKSTALKHAYRFTQNHDMQLLDQTVALASLKFVKDKRYIFALRRIYRFEFTIRGDRRYKGKVLLTGFHLDRIESDAVVESDFLEP